LIEWRKVAGLRDILAHAYLSVDEDLLWDILQHHIGPLHQTVQPFPAQDEGSKITAKNAHPTTPNAPYTQQLPKLALQRGISGELLRIC